MMGEMNFFAGDAAFSFLSMYNFSSPWHFLMCILFVILSPLKYFVAFCFLSGKQTSSQDLSPSFNLWGKPDRPAFMHSDMLREHS